MDIKNRNKIIMYFVLGGAAVFGVAYLAHNAYSKNKSGLGGSVVGSMTRNQAIRIIENFSGVVFKNSDGYGTDYLVSRAQAISSSSPTFRFNNKIYDTYTGNAV